MGVAHCDSQVPLSTYGPQRGVIGLWGWSQSPRAAKDTVTVHHLETVFPGGSPGLDPDLVNLSFSEVLWPGIDSQVRELTITHPYTVYSFFPKKCN